MPHSCICKFHLFSFFLLLLAAHVVAESTFFSVNILKAKFSTTPRALSALLNDFNVMLDIDHLAPSSESSLGPVDLVSCACGSFGALDASRTCSTPPPPTPLPFS